MFFHWIEDDICVCVRQGIVSKFAANPVTVLAPNLLSKIFGLNIENNLPHADCYHKSTPEASYKPEIRTNWQITIAMHS